MTIYFNGDVSCSSHISGSPKKHPFPTIGQLQPLYKNTKTCHAILVSLYQVSVIRGNTVILEKWSPQWACSTTGHYRDTHSWEGHLREPRVSPALLLILYQAKNIWHLSCLDWFSAISNQVKQSTQQATQTQQSDGDGSCQKYGSSIPSASWPRHTAFHPLVACSWTEINGHTPWCYHNLSLMYTA